MYLDDPDGVLRDFIESSQITGQVRSFTETYFLSIL